MEGGKEASILDTKMFEPEPDGFAGIAVSNMRKVFKRITGQQVIAIDDVSFKAYKGQITALLGHNGAGKTTTMSVLTGENALQHHIIFKRPKLYI
jgi:ABC-type uncharacterized transport system ATPase subunit